MPWRAPGATILYRLLCFFVGVPLPAGATGSPLTGPNATKWLDKVERKILHWPGSSKGKSHLPALSHTPNCHDFVQALPQRAPAPTILYRLLLFFLGYLCLQAKHLEDATKWPHKVDRKILDWPGSSKATQAIPRPEEAKATYQPCHTPARATILYRHCLGEPQGPPFCTGCFREFWVPLCRSHETPPNQTKYLEDATKWPHKVEIERKILDWPGSSKATQAISARATYQPCHTPPRATILSRQCLGEPQGPPFCTGCFVFFWYPTGSPLTGRNAWKVRPSGWTR